LFNITHGQFAGLGNLRPRRSIGNAPGDSLIAQCGVIVKLRDVLVMTETKFLTAAFSSGFVSNPGVFLDMELKRHKPSKAKTPAVLPAGTV